MENRKMENVKNIQLKSRCVVLNDGTKKWYNKEGKLHRDDDLPAIERTDGSQLWYTNGKLNREGDLPAIIEAVGCQLWYKDGELDREGDLPAVIGVDGSKWWFKKGKEVKTIKYKNNLIKKCLSLIGAID